CAFQQYCSTELRVTYMLPPPAYYPRFPYTTLFRSARCLGILLFYRQTQPVAVMAPVGHGLAIQLGLLSGQGGGDQVVDQFQGVGDRKSTRLNSSHVKI